MKQIQSLPIWGAFIEWLAEKRHVAVPFYIEQIFLGDPFQTQLGWYIQFLSEVHGIEIDKDTRIQLLSIGKIPYAFIIYHRDTPVKVKQIRSTDLMQGYEKACIAGMELANEKLKIKS